MSKGNDEIAAEILIALISARGDAAKSPSSNVTNVNFIVQNYLSDEAVAKAYKTIFNAVTDAYNGR